MSKGDWTEERVAKAIELWKEGYSMSRISRALNCGLSRNAVIGKLARLGITGGLNISRQPTFRTMGVPKKFRPAPPPPPPPDQPVPLGEVHTFVPTGQCKWIHGDIGSAWQMCGHPVHAYGSPWCLFHWHRARAKSQEVAA